MAGRMEAKIAAPALFSLLAVSLLAHALLVHRPRATAWFLSAVDAFRFDDAHRFLELVNRRNMILLCNAILLVILKDVGILAAPARPHSSTAAPATNSEARPQPSSTAAGADQGRLKLERRVPEAATARVRRGKPLMTRATRKEYAAVQRSIPRRNRAPPAASTRHQFDHGATGNEIAVVTDRISSLHSGQVADEERRRAKEDTARQETELECADDVDELNRKFDEFIASVRRKMQLESLQAQVQV